jgi:peptidoglycan/xylan/chitin deacetylase (PgdA/CDA1 family)
MVIRNFLFHRVSDEPDRLWPPTSVSLFKSIISYLTRRYHVINLEDYLLSGETPKSRKKIAAISFDDGYKDNIKYAVPILAQYKCPASFYVSTICIDNNVPTWTYVLDFLFQNTKKTNISLERDFVPPQFRKNEFASESARLDFVARLKPWMKGLSNNNRKLLLADIQTSITDVEPPASRMMNWNDLRQMKADKFMIGSHTVSHPLLANIEDDDELVYELKESGERIRSELGEFPFTISYPVGSYNKKVMEQSREIGYRFGLAVGERFYDTGKDDLFSIPRVELGNESLLRCNSRPSGVYTTLKGMLKA